MNAVNKRRRRAWLSGLAVGTALVLASCGTDGDDPDSMSEDAAVVAEPTDSARDTEDTDTEDTDAEDTDAEDTDAEDTDAEDTDAEDTDEDLGEDSADLAAGVYRAYSQEAVADPAFDTTIIFFHASWCPECRAFEQAIEAGPIPDGVQILKADYDTETDLKGEYDVSIQTTFVKVDAEGNELSTWVGYQKDRSVDTILSELG